MRKTVLYLAALAASASVAATPMNSYAASGQVYIGNGCSVIKGQGTESLRQTLEELGIVIGSGNIVCPVVPGNGGTEGETPTQPGAGSGAENQNPGVTQPGGSNSGNNCAGSNGSNEGNNSSGSGDFNGGNNGSNSDDSNEENNGSASDDSNNGNNNAGTTPDNGNSGSNSDSDAEQPGEEASSEAEQVVKLVNEERAKRGLSALTIDTKVTAAANVRAREIKQSFAHTRPDGTSFSTALKEQGVSYRGSGENIAWGQKSPEQVMSAWMGSDGHRANILNENYKNIGVGYYQDANGVKYWVQLFTY